jgi:DNA gyrase subunit B
VPCKNRTNNEIFIIEGRSAAGQAKVSRDSDSQALLSLRGKIINAERADFKKLIKFEAVKNIIYALGTGVGKNFDISKLRYERILLMMDADCDGYQIRGLLIAFFYQQMRELIKHGHLYIVQPPLFRLNFKKKESFFLNRSDLEKYLILEAGIDI